jgi:hypothetical protein
VLENRYASHKQHANDHHYNPDHYEKHAQKSAEDRHRFGRFVVGGRLSNFILETARRASSKMARIEKHDLIPALRTKRNWSIHNITSLRWPGLPTRFDRFGFEVIV